MIAKGTDGLSRGDLTNGVLTGCPILSYVPLNKGISKRSPKLVSWLADALSPETTWKTLTPEGWFNGSICADHAIWTPSPATAEVALETLCEARHVTCLPAQHL
jgi:hypothetical protein